MEIITMSLALNVLNPQENIQPNKTQLTNITLKIKIIDMTFQVSLYTYNCRRHVKTIKYLNHLVNYFYYIAFNIQHFAVSLSKYVKERKNLI